MQANPITKGLIRLSGDRRAVTAIEYALIGAFIVVVIVASVTSMGQSLIVPFNTIAAAF